MEKFLPVLSASSLFAGVTDKELPEMLHCLHARKLHYRKGEYLLHAGEKTESLGLVLEGRVLVVSEDVWGGRNLLTSIGPGETFAETFACVPGAVMSVSVTAEEPCTVLYLRVQQMLDLCPGQCSHHGRMVRNLLTDMARKNLAFSAKLTHLGQRTTRAKLLSYLSAEARRQGKREFDIPFSRQQLADYLLVERSGLSQELGRLRDEGLLCFDRCHFQLLEEPLPREE